jgi:hypothetical protein
MILDKEVVTYIENLALLCRTAGIESFIIDEGKIRGIDDQKSVVLFDEYISSNLPFSGIGIGRVSSLLQRIDGVRQFGDYEVVANLRPETEQVSYLVLKTKSMRVEFNCTNPANIKVPKRILDTPAYQFTISPDDVNNIAKANTMMKGEKLIINGVDNKITFVIKDTNEDSFTYETGIEFNIIDESAPSEFSNAYSIKSVLSLLKEQPDQNQVIEVGGQKGIMDMKIKDMMFYILRRV